MFTGIIEAKGKVRAARTRDGSLAVTVTHPRGWKLAIGGSIAADGICLTVTKRGAGAFSAKLMPETLRKTTGGAWKAGRVVNLERPLAFGSPLDGHLVQGHVEGRAEVTSVSREGRSRLLTLRLPAGLRKRAALHGSITVNGVSLTLARVRGGEATVALIPHTLARTNLGLLAAGDEANVETDFIAGSNSRASMRAYAKKRERSRRA